MSILKIVSKKRALVSQIVLAVGITSSLVSSNNFQYSKSIAIASTVSTTTPAIFNASIEGKPGDIIGLQGARFGKNPQVWMTKADNQKLQLKIVNKGNNYIAAQIPASVEFGMYGIEVFNGTYNSQTVYLNIAIAHSFDTPEIAANGKFRIFGRNLLVKGATPVVRFVDRATKASMSATAITTGSDAYVLKVKAPSQIKPGSSYDVYVSNGYGGARSETIVATPLIGRTGGLDKWQLGVPWAADYDFYNNIYNVKTDQRLSVHAVGDGVNNDQPAIQNAIAKAAKAGGVVYLPAGTYRLATQGQGLLMASRVVLAGAGQDQTTINFGYGQPRGEAGIWWPDGTKLSGIVDLTYRNVNTGGHWRSNLGATNSEQLFIQRTRLEFNSAGGIFWTGMPKMVVANSIINQTCDPQNQNGGPWHFDGNSYFVIRNNQVTACDQYGINFAQNGVIESNHFTKDARVFVPGRNLVANFAKNIIILNNTFDLSNGPDKVNNDGETILSEGGGAQRFNHAGTITSATTDTLEDNSKNWLSSQFNFNNQDLIVVIVSGEGAGQWRKIKSHTATSLRLERPWDVIPTNGSRYTVIAWSAANWLIKGNTLQDHARGIQFYNASSLNIAIVGNKLLNNGAIWLRANQDLSDSNSPQFDVNYNIQVLGNTLINTRVTADKSQSQGAFIAVQPGLVKPSHIFGTLALGIEIKNNSIEGMMDALYSDDYQDGYYNSTYIFQPPQNVWENENPAILGTIFQNNSCKNCSSVFNLNGGAYQTVIWNSTLNGSKDLMRDTFLDGTNRKSVNTVVGP